MRQIMILALCSIVSTTASAEICKRKIDNNVEKLAGYKWQHRDVDAKRCWYYSNRILPREDLVWSFTEEEFNSDIDRVIQRKFYHLDLDENGLLRQKDAE